MLFLIASESFWISERKIKEGNKIRRSWPEINLQTNRTQSRTKVNFSAIFGAPLVNIYVKWSFELLLHLYKEVLHFSLILSSHENLRKRKNVIFFYVFGIVNVGTNTTFSSYTGKNLLNLTLFWS